MRIVVDEVGVTVMDAKTRAAAWHARWADVTQIVAWKDDVFSYDLICMGFKVETAGGGPVGAGLTEEPRYFRCDEEQPGWKELLENVERVFGIRTADWWQPVAFPAFAENAMVLWQARRRGQVE